VNFLYPILLPGGQSGQANTLWLASAVPSQSGDLPGGFQLNDLLFVVASGAGQGGLYKCSVSGSPGTWMACSASEAGAGSFTNFYSQQPISLVPGDGHNGLTDTTGVAKQIWLAPVLIPYGTTLTGIAFLIGSVGGTDNACVAIYDGSGKLLAQSAAAGVLVGTADTFQKIPFTATVSVVGPGLHFIAVQTNGTTAHIQTITAGVQVTGILAGAGQTFGVFPTPITVPTTFTTAEGPVCSTY